MKITRIILKNFIHLLTEILEIVILTVQMIVQFLIIKGIINDDPREI